MRFLFIFLLIPVCSFAQHDMGGALNITLDGRNSPPFPGVRIFGMANSHPHLQPGGGVDIVSSKNWSTREKGVTTFVFFSCNYKLSKKPVYPYIGAAAGYFFPSPGHAGPIVGGQIGLVFARGTRLSPYIEYSYRRLFAQSERRRVGREIVATDYHQFLVGIRIHYEEL